MDDEDKVLNTGSSNGRVVTLAGMVARDEVEIVIDLAGINNGSCEIVNCYCGLLI